MDRKLKVGVITGSTRQGRVGDKIAKWFIAIAQARPELEVRSLDLVDWPLPFYDQPKSPKQIGADYPTQIQRDWVLAVSEQDAFVWVTSEYNFGYPASLKNAIDHVYAGWNAKPVGMVSYGGVSGGTRAVQQLRQVAVELQMMPIREEVNITWVQRAIAQTGAPTDQLTIYKAELMLDQLTWWGTALVDAKARTPIPPPRPLPQPR